MIRRTTIAEQKTVYHIFVWYLFDRTGDHFGALFFVLLVFWAAGPTDNRYDRRLSVHRIEHGNRFGCTNASSAIPIVYPVGTTARIDLRGQQLRGYNCNIMYNTALTTFTVPWRTKAMYTKIYTYNVTIYALKTLFDSARVVWRVLV